MSGVKEYYKKFCSRNNNSNNKVEVIHVVGSRVGFTAAVLHLIYDEQIDDITYTWEHHVRWTYR